MHKTIQKNGIKYYFFNTVVELFKEYVDEHIEPGEVAYALRETNFPFRSITLNKNGKDRVAGLYRQSTMDEILHDEDRRRELRQHINYRRNKINNEFARRLKHPTKQNVKYLNKDENEIYWDLVKREKEEAEERKKRELEIKMIEPETETWYPEESDMEYVSKALLDKDIYESENLSDVETEWTPKEGIFLEKDPKKIAAYLLRNSKDRGQAMKRLTFYMNRSGENLKNKTVLNRAKKLLKESIKYADKFIRI